MPVRLLVLVCSLTCCPAWRMPFWPRSKPTPEQVTTPAPVQTATLKASTRPTREVILGDQLLVTVNGKWYIRKDDGVLDEILMKGDGRGHLKGVLHGRTDSGMWYTFQNPPESFKIYLSKRPMKFDINRVVYNGANWFVRDQWKMWQKLVYRGTKDWGEVFYARAEDGVWYKFINSTGSELLCSYITRLPAYVVTETPHGQNPTIDTKTAIELMHKECSLELRSSNKRIV